MRVLGLLFILLALVLAKPSAASSGALERLREIALKKDFASGAFSLSKEISDLGIKVKSSGTFSIKKGEGLLWKNELPEKFTFFANADYYTFESGGKKQKNKIGDYDIAGAIDKLFSGDFSDLQEKFALSVSKFEGCEIILKLEPKVSDIKNFITFIEVKFAGDKLARAVISMENGDIIAIDFSENKL